MSIILFLTLSMFQDKTTVFADRIAIKVNDKIITEQELVKIYKNFRREALQKYTGAELDAKLKEAWADAIATSEETLLLYEKAVDTGVAYSRDEAISQLISVKESHGLSDDEFAKEIFKQTGMTFDEMVDSQTRDNSANAVLHQEVIGRIKIDDSEIAKYYDEHQDQYLEPATYRISEVVFLKNPENASEIRKKAEACLTEIQNGLDFADAARKHSDSISKEDGGDLGIAQYGDLLGAIEDQVKNLGVGEVSTILETQSAFFIIKVTEKNPATPKPLESVRDDIIAKIREPRFQTAYDAFMTKLRSEFLLEIYVEKVPWYLEL